jgi:hypothetical protein
MFEVVYGTACDCRTHKYHLFLLVYFMEKIVGLQLHSQTSSSPVADVFCT